MLVGGASLDADGWAELVGLGGPPEPTAAGDAAAERFVPLSTIDRCSPGWSASTRPAAQQPPVRRLPRDYLDRPGVRIARDPSDDGTKANLLVATGPEPADREGLVLSGHMDVVPADETDWRSDPFTLTDAGDRLVGRGAADMKGFLALAANRLAAIDPATTPRVRWSCSSPTTRRSARSGARRFHRDVRRTPARCPAASSSASRRRSASCGPTRAWCGLRLDFLGRAAHPAIRIWAGARSSRRPAPSSPWRSCAASHGSRASALRRLFPAVPFVALNVGTVAGGSAANVIPDRCEVSLGVRCFPGMTAGRMGERVIAAYRARGRHGAFTFECVSESPRDDARRRRADSSGACEAVGQREDHSVMFATDAGWLQHAGFECVLFGPGSIEVAHQAERMPSRSPSSSAPERLSTG